MLKIADISQSQPRVLAQGSARKEYADRLFRRWPIVVLGLLPILGGLLAYRAIPGKYESELLLLFRPARTQLAEGLELLNGADVYRAVAPDAEAADRLRRAVRILPAWDANMVRLRYAAESADDAAATLNAIGQALIDREAALAPKPAAEPDPEAARQALARFRRDNGVIALDNQKDLLLRKIEAADSAMRAAEAEEAGSVRRAADLERAMAGVEPRISTSQRRIPNQYSAERLSTLLAELQNRRTELLAKYLDGDRNVKQVEQQIADTRKALGDAAAGEAREETTDLNPLRQTLNADLLRARAQSGATRARAEAINRQIAGYRSGLARLESLTSEHDELARGASAVPHPPAEVTVVIAESAKAPAGRNPRPVGWATLAAGAAALAWIALAAVARPSAVNTPAALDQVAPPGALATIARIGRSGEAKGFLSPLIDEMTAATDGDDGRIYAFTAAADGEGVSTAVRLIARRMAGFGNVLVLEGGGEAAAMAGDTNIRELEPGVFAISLASYVPHGSPGDAAERLRRLRSRFRYTLIDGGAVAEPRGVRSLAQFVDATVLVVSAGRLPARSITAAARALERLPARFAGCVLNRRTYPAPGFIYNRL